MKYGISEKVWNAIIGTKNPTLPRIMFAAALDPLLIHDLYDIPEPRSLIECVRLADMGTRGDLRNYLRGVLTEWIMEQGDARAAIRPIAKWDQRLGVWLAAAAAENVLRFVPASEKRPTRAVQAARDWVYGLATVRDVRAAADAVYAYAADAYAADASAAAAFYASAAYYAADAADDASAAADDDAAAEAAAAAAIDAVDVAASRDVVASHVAATRAAAISLRETLANAVWTYPLEQS